MKSAGNVKDCPAEVPQYHEAGHVANRNNDTARAFAELERAVYKALETYSNVHRGSGHYSMVTTHLYE